VVKILPNHGFPAYRQSGPFGEQLERCFIERDVLFERELLNALCEFRAETT